MADARRLAWKLCDTAQYAGDAAAAARHLAGVAAAKLGGSLLAALNRKRRSGTHSSTKSTSKSCFA